MPTTTTPVYENDVAIIAQSSEHPDIYVLTPKQKALSEKQWSNLTIAAERFANSKEPRTSRSLVIDLSGVTIASDPSEIVEPLARLNLRLKQQQEKLVLLIPESSPHRGECKVPIISDKSARTHTRLDSLVAVVDTLDEAIACCTGQAATPSQ